MCSVFRFLYTSVWWWNCVLYDIKYNKNIGLLYCCICCQAVYDKDIRKLNVQLRQQTLTVLSVCINYYGITVPKPNRVQVNIIANMNFCLHGKLCDCLWVFQNPRDKIIIFTTMQNAHFHKCGWDVGFSQLTNCWLHCYMWKLRQ